jgi:hypothetical protein
MNISEKNWLESLGIPTISTGARYVHPIEPATDDETVPAFDTLPDNVVALYPLEEGN